MAQRLTFNVELLRDMVKTFDTMYVADKLYDYANYITIYGDGERMYFEMCVIMDGASNDAMVRLYAPYKGDSFDKLIINFAELRSIMKGIKSEEVVFELDGKNLTVKTDKATHISEASTVAIPRQITDTLDNFFKENADKMLDFNLLKLYNYMNDIGSNLTMNTLNSKLYGIMSTPNFIVSTDGFSMAIYPDSPLQEQFMFPKHSIRILKMLPKIGAKYATVGHRMFIRGVGFECYIGEWSGYKEYPIAAVEKFMKMELVPIPDASEAFDAIKQCHQFDDLAYIQFGKGLVSNKKGTHVETFVPVAEFNDTRFVVHRSILASIDKVDTLSASPTQPIGRLTVGNKIYIFLGVQDNEND